jgi:hypothetical protein
MPDKRTPCGGTCIKCWVNRLKHGNKQSKAYLKKLGKLVDPSAYNVETPGPSENYKFDAKRDALLSKTKMEPFDIPLGIVFKFKNRKLIDRYMAKDDIVSE